jgi:hypothetical protein
VSKAFKFISGFTEIRLHIYMWKRLKREIKALSACYYPGDV